MYFYLGLGLYLNLLLHVSLRRLLYLNSFLICREKGVSRITIPDNDNKKIKPITESQDKLLFLFLLL